MSVDCCLYLQTFSLGNIFNPLHTSCPNRQQKIQFREQRQNNLLATSWMFNSIITATLSLFKSVTQLKRNYMSKCFVFTCHLSFCGQLQMQRRLCCPAKCFVQHNTAIISECQGKDAEPHHHIGVLVHSSAVWKQYYHNWLNRRTHNSVVSHWNKLFLSDPSLVWTDFFSLCLSLYEK